jgi:hypothetical protein
VLETFWGPCIVSIASRVSPTMLTRSFNDMDGAVRRVQDAQEEKQDAIGRWLLASGRSPWMRRGLQEYLKDHASPQTVLSHWNDLTNLTSPGGTVYVTCAARVLSLAYFPMEPCSKIREAPALLRKLWTGDGKHSRAESLLQGFLDTLQPLVRQGRLLPQLCLLVAMVDTATRVGWAEGDRWALTWLQGVALDSAHALHMHAVCVMLDVHRTLGAHIMEHPALDVHVLHVLPKWNPDIAHGTVLARLWETCSSMPSTDTTELPSTRSPTRVPWSRPAAAKVARWLLAASKKCWEADGPAREAFSSSYSCRCETCYCALLALVPLLCVLMARPNAGACSLPRSLWRRVIAAQAPAPWWPYFGRCCDNDTRRVLVYNLAMVNGIPADQVQHVLLSPFLFPLFNRIEIKEGFTCDYRYYPYGKTVTEWACLQKLLEDHPVLPLQCVSVLQRRLAAAQTGLAADSTVGTPLHSQLTLCLEIGRQRAQRWSRPRGQWLTLQLSVASVASAASAASAAP